MIYRSEDLRTAFLQQGPVVVLRTGVGRRQDSWQNRLEAEAKALVEKANSEFGTSWKLHERDPIALVTSSWGERIAVIAWNYESFQIDRAFVDPECRDRQYLVAAYDVLQERRPDLGIAAVPELADLKKAVDRFLADRPDHRPGSHTEGANVVRGVA